MPMAAPQTFAKPACLGDTSWEIAVPRDTQEERALEVEQCECPPGYTGTSCEDCAEGYERSGHGPYLGYCVPARQPPARPLCDSAGALSAHPQHDGNCDCKQNVVGVTCDRCAPESFNLAPQNPHGCLRCFCSGVTRACESSHWRRNRIELDYARGDRDQLDATTSDARSPYKPPTQPQVHDGSINFNGFYEARGQTLYWSLPQKFLGDKVTAYGGKLRYTFRFSGSGSLNADADVIIRGNNIQLQYSNRQQVHADRDNSVEIPITELGWRHSNGVSASREQLMMVLADLDGLLIKMSYMRECSQASLVSVSLDNADAYGAGETASDVEQCQCPSGYIGTSCEDCAPGYSRTGGGPYLGTCEKCECYNHASECDAEYGACIECQHNTEGDRCERCKPGFVGDASRGTPYDCRPAPEAAVTRPRCECHNHSPRGCDSYGRCILCEHNTEGFHCELCKKGFYGNSTKRDAVGLLSVPLSVSAFGDAVMDPSVATARQALRDVSAMSAPLVTRLARLLMAASVSRSASISRPKWSSCRNPMKSSKPASVSYDDHPNCAADWAGTVTEGFEPIYPITPKQLSIQEGSRAKWTCKIVSADKPDLVDIQWSRIGAVELPARAQQFGHQLVIDRIQQEDAGHYRCTGRLKGDISTDDATLTIASPQAAPADVHFPAPAAMALPTTAAQMPKPVVTPPHQLVDEGQQAVFTCLTPGYADCEVQWHYQRLGGPLPNGWEQRGNQIIVQSAQHVHAGDYICSVTHQFGTTASDPGRLEIQKPPSVCPPVCHAPPSAATVTAPPPIRPLVEPPEIETDLDSPARFRCWVPGVPGAVLNWRPVHGEALPAGADQSGGYLDFPRVSKHHPGQYVCAAYDPSRDPIGSRPVDSDHVQLKLRPKKPFQVLVEPPYQIVDEGQPLPRPFRCWVPGYPQAVLKWRPALDETLPSGLEEQHSGALLNVQRAELRHAGDYICTAYDPHEDPRGEQKVDSTPVRLDVRRPSPPPPPPSRPRNPPQVEPPYQRVDLGQPARFRCWVPGEPNAHLSWAPARGGPLPAGAVDRSGHLAFDAVAHDHAGSYVCSSIDPETGQILQSPPVRLDVNAPSKRPLVEPIEQTVQQGHPSRIRCWVPDEPHAPLRWTARGERPLPSGAVDDGRGILNIAQTLPHHQGDYECIYEPREPTGRGPQVSEPARIYVSPPPLAPLERKPGEPPKPVATPPLQTLPRGDPARFHCEPNSKTPAQIHWGFESANGALPTGVSVDGEDILIAAADEATIGEYHCTATNEFGRGHADPVRL
uniref:Basement membrane proteoglycan n=1 Tax=Globodera pallida TaxID=36090 RepID=A0A183CLT8_GLOPA